MWCPALSKVLKEELQKVIDSMDKLDFAHHLLEVLQEYIKVIIDCLD